MKTCRKCSRDLPPEAFPINRRLRDGLHSWCRDCMRIAVRASRARAGDRYNARKRNLLKNRSTTAVPALKLDPAAADYLRAVAADPCAYCGAPASDLDHIQAQSDGGTDGWENFTAACRACNNKKQALSLLGFMLQREPLAA